jgi:hypothetical protein
VANQAESSQNHYSQVDFPALQDVYQTERLLRKGGSWGGITSMAEYWRRVAESSRARLEKGDYEYHASSYLTKTLFDGEYINYFLGTSNLFNFLCETEVLEDSGFLTVIQESCTEKATTGIVVDISSGLVDKSTGSEAAVFTGVIHSKGAARSIIFQATYSAGGGVSLHITNGNEAVIIQHKIATQEMSRMKHERNLVINLFMYLDCFPESIRNGTPDVCVQPYRLSTQSKQNFHIVTHESLLEKGGPAPHFRRGHFRRLMSEHWTNKRGKTVFVRSAFVRGKAKTVEEVPNMKEMPLLLTEANRQRLRPSTMNATGRHPGDGK